MSGIHGASGPGIDSSVSPSVDNGELSVTRAIEPAGCPMSSVAHGSLLAGGLVERNEPIVVCDRLHLISDLLLFHIEAEQRSSDLVE